MQSVFVFFSVKVLAMEKSVRLYFALQVILIVYGIVPVEGEQITWVVLSLSVSINFKGHKIEP